MPARWKSLPWLSAVVERSRFLRFWLARDEDVRVFSCDAWLVLAITVVWFTVAYALNDSPSWNPGGNAGWLVWWDQSQYHKEAAELAHGELRANAYWIGYPALGAIFERVLPRQPFFVPDLALVLTLVAVFYAAARLYVSRLEAVLLVYVFIWFDSLLRDECLVIPWNTLPAYAAFFVSIYLLILRPRPPRVADFILCSGLTGLAALARPTEIVALALIQLPALFRLERGRERVAVLAALGAVTLAVAAALLLLNEHLYHTLQSPYLAGESGKLNPANYGLKAYQFFLDGRFLTGDGALPAGTRPPSVLSRYPEFLLVLPGLLFLTRERGWAALGLVLPIAFTVGFYLLYIPFDNPPYAWSYGQWHYLAWLFPWLGLATYLTFRRAYGALSRKTFVVALLLPLFATFVIGFAAIPSASASATTTDRMRLTDHFAAGVYAVQLQMLEDVQADDLRLIFRHPPPYYGTETSTLHLVQVAVNGRVQQDMVDCMTSQENATYHFSFLAHGLVLQTGDLIEIRFQTRKALELERAELASIRYAPLQAWRDCLAP